MWEGLNYDSSVAFIFTAKPIRFGVLIWHCRLQAVLTLIKRIFSLIFTIQWSHSYTSPAGQTDENRLLLEVLPSVQIQTCTLAKPYLPWGKSYWVFFLSYLTFSFLWGIHPNISSQYSEQHQGMQDTSSEAGNISSSQNFTSEQSYSVAIWTVTLNVFFSNFHQRVFGFIHSFISSVAAEMFWIRQGEYSWLFGFCST